MFCKSLFSICVYSFFCFISGCDKDPKPEISSQRPILTLEAEHSWIPPKLIEKKWTAIVIHHSATAFGNSTIFDQWHKDRNWDGVGYDFVIGNGTDSPDGQIEVTFRWTQQKTGAHAGGTPDNWANQTGIGICLVGNFNLTQPTDRQMESVIKLVDFMKKRYEIPNDRIYGHGSVPGGHKTECPGKLFPMYRLKN